MKIIQKTFDKSHLVYAVLITLLFTSCSPEKTSLFNGKDLEGWKNYGTEKWYVKMVKSFVKVTQTRNMDT